MRMEAEMGVMHLQAEECQGLPAGTRSQEKGMGDILPHSLYKKPTLLTP